MSDELTELADRLWLISIENRAFSQEAATRTDADGALDIEKEAAAAPQEMVAALEAFTHDVSAWALRDGMSEAEAMRLVADAMTSRGSRAGLWDRAQRLAGHPEGQSCGPDCQLYD